MVTMSNKLDEATDLANLKENISEVINLYFPASQLVL